MTEYVVTVDFGVHWATLTIYAESKEEALAISEKFVLIDNNGRRKKATSSAGLADVKDMDAKALERDEARQTP